MLQSATLSITVGQACVVFHLYEYYCAIDARLTPLNAKSYSLYIFFIILI